MLAVALIGLVLAVSETRAQARPHITQTPEELLSALVRESQLPPGTSSTASLNLTYVLLYHPDYPAPHVEALLRGLEQIALTADSSALGASAVLYLAVPSSRRSARPLAGAMARLERVYRISKEALVRSSAVAAMGGLAVDRPAAIAFLERIAVQAVADYPGSAEGALGALVAMDEEGRAVLRRLYETAAVRDPEARQSLSVLASRGYRIP
jgi:hypothetical protein